MANKDTSVNKFAVNEKGELGFIITVDTLDEANIYIGVSLTGDKKSWISLKPAILDGVPDADGLEAVLDIIDPPKELSGPLMGGKVKITHIPMPPMMGAMEGMDDSVRAMLDAMLGMGMVPRPRPKLNKNDFELDDPEFPSD